MAQEPQESKMDEHLKSFSPDFGLLKRLINDLMPQIIEDQSARDLPHPNDVIQPLSTGDLTVLVDMQVKDHAGTPDSPSTVDQFKDLRNKIETSLMGPGGGEIMTPEQLEEIQRYCDFFDDLTDESRIDGTVACKIIQTVSQIIDVWKEKVVKFCKELTNMTGKYEVEEKNYRSSIVEIETLKKNKRHRDMRQAKKEFIDFALGILNAVMEIRKGLLALDISVDFSSPIEEAMAQSQLHHTELRAFLEIAKQDRTNANEKIDDLHHQISHLLNVLKSNRLVYADLQENHPESDGTCNFMLENERLIDVLAKRRKLREDCAEIPTKIASRKATILILEEHIRTVASVQRYYEGKAKFASKIENLISRISELVQESIDSFSAQLNSKLEILEKVYCDIFSHIHKEVHMTLHLKKRNLDKLTRENRRLAAGFDVAEEEEDDDEIDRLQEEMDKNNKRIDPLEKEIDILQTKISSLDGHEEVVEVLYSKYDKTHYRDITEDALAGADKRHQRAIKKQLEREQEEIDARQQQYSQYFTRIGAGKSTRDDEGLPNLEKF